MRSPSTPTAWTRRRILVAGAGGLAGTFTGCASPPFARNASREAASAVASPVTRAGADSGLRLIGEATLAYRLRFKDTTVGGLSGLDYDAAANLWYALSDDGAGAEPARFYTLRIGLSPTGIDTPRLIDVVTLRQPDGKPYPGRREGGEVPDPESIRLSPATGTIFWSSEGDVRNGLAPSVHEAGRDGRQLRRLALPPMFDVATRSGPRHNLAFEGLAITPDGRGLWAAMEAAMLQDGDVPTVARVGGPCRFTRFDVATGRAVRQIAYVPDAIPSAPVPPGAFADNGVSEVLMLDEHRMLVLERAYASGAGNSIRLYRIDTRDGDDVLAQPSLSGGAWRACAKTLVADFATLGLSRLDNTEGMAWGPVLPGGRRTLVFVSDDNFNPGQITQFAAFEYLE